MLNHLPGGRGAPRGIVLGLPFQLFRSPNDFSQVAEVVVEVVPYAEAEVAVVDYDMTDNYLSSLDDVFHHMSCHACLSFKSRCPLEFSGGLVMFVALSMSLPLEFYVATIDRDHRYLHHATPISRRLAIIFSHLISW